MDWTVRQWSGLDWTEPDHFRRLNWTARDFTGLDYTALAWIELESTIQDTHCTSLD